MLDAGNVFLSSQFSVQALTAIFAGEMVTSALCVKKVIFPAEQGPLSSNKECSDA